jgi:hypothetical protein
MDIKRALVSVLRLTILVSVLFLLPYINRLNAQIGTSSCQTWTQATFTPCPNCCSKPGGSIQDVPFSDGPGVQSLVATAYDCGTALPGGCSTACSGTTYVPQDDNACCVKDGGSCSINAQCCGTPGDVCTNGKCTAPPPPSGCPYPSGSPPYCGAGNAAQWNTSTCSWMCVPTGTSPILIDVSGKGFQLTSAAGGVLFDISGTGHPVQMGWTAPGANNAFLCLPDSGGRCDDGKDLFGNFTPQPPSDTPNGFAALAVYDDPKNGGNGDGVIDARDAIFASLRLWIDENHDGVSQPEEIYTLASLSVNSISLTYKLSEKEDQYGNLLRYRARVNPDDPDASHVGRTAYDVFFVTLDSSTKNLMNPEGPKCTVPTSTKGGMLSTASTLR